jgi:hypothetical protein
LRFACSRKDVSMEVLLQLWDEIDDWLGCIRQAWLSLRFDLPTDVDFSSTSILR